jgi:hypothetical protein
VACKCDFTRRATYWLAYESHADRQWHNRSKTMKFIKKLFNEKKIVIQQPEKRILSVVEIDHVSGGSDINPQPLPPCRAKLA